MMRTIWLLTSLLFIPQLLLAELIFQPPSLEPGDRYRLVFVTSETRDATSSNIEDYNDFVQRLADASPIVSTWGLEWKAIASTATADAIDNIGANLGEHPPVFVVDGQPFTGINQDNPRHSVLPANANSVFFNDEIISEMGEVVPPQLNPSFGVLEVAVWTGTNTSGLAAGNSRALGSSGAMYGLAGGPFMFEYRAASSENHFHLYGISEVITAVPEPKASALFVCAIVGMMAFRQRQR